MSGGPRPPEVLNVTCVSKSEGVAIFTDEEGNKLTLNGNTEYFVQGDTYKVTFKPTK